MKKITVVIVLLLSIVMGVRAQEFESQVKVGYSNGIDNYKNKSFGIEYLAGVRFNDYVRIGAGIGANYCDLLFEEAGYNKLLHSYFDEYREAAMSMPIFINGKFNFSNTSISPYLGIDLGYSLYIPFSDYAKENELGIFVKPAFGVDFNVGKGDIFVEIGYKYQTRKFYDTINYSQIVVSLGYEF